MARNIPLRTVETNAAKFDYRQQLIQFAAAPQGEGGMSAAEMFEAHPIVAKLQTHEGRDAVILEEAEWRFLWERVESGKFPGYHDVWVNFIASVRDAETVKIVEADAAD